MNSVTTKERGIIFTAESVRAIQNRSKTQTRRVVRFPSAGSWELAQRPEQWGEQNEHWAFVDMADPIGTYPTCLRCPYGVPGDRLWVRETWRQGRPMINGPDSDSDVAYKADWRWNTDHKWKSPIHMPRWVSRITLELTDVRAQRAKEISEEDAQAEGVEAEFEVNAADFVHNKSWDATKASTYRLGFKHLWNRLNARREGCSWRDNPWVWGLTFKVVDE